MVAPGTLATSATDRAYPSPAYSWYMVVLLTSLYIISFVDRYIVALLIEPIKADLGLTDTQAAMLLGPAFAVFYALMGLPLGWLADRGRRTLIVALGLLVWSLATAASGLAGSFLFLLMARMLVGTGEAALSPCAMSLIGDSFSKEKRGRPIAFYTAALSLGAGIAALAGAAVITWTTTAEAVSLPLFGPLSPWRLTLIAVGLPGLALVPLVLTLREPRRRGQLGSNQAQLPNFSDLFGHISKNWGLFLSFISVFAYMILIGYTINWGAAVFARTWDWSIVKYATATGIMFLVLGPIAVNASGLMSDRLVKRGMVHAPMAVALTGIPVMSIGAFAWPIMPTGELALVFFALVIVGTAITTATAITAMLNIVPSAVRGQAVALYFIVTTLFGLGFGPLAIGLMSDYIFGEADLRYALSVLPVLFGTPLMLFWKQILRIYRTAIIDDAG